MCVLAMFVNFVCIIQSVSANIVGACLFLSFPGVMCVFVCVM